MSASRLSRRTMNARELGWLVLRLFGMTAGVSSLACIVAAHLVWNFTPSLPLGLYWLSPGAPPALGQLVAFPVPDGMRWLVHERRYLPPGAELVKPVVAVPGDQVCAEESTLWVNGAALGTILAEDTAGRPLPHYAGCGPVPEGQIFVASPYAQSFDSRTFGPVPAAVVRGRVIPLWTY